MDNIDVIFLNEPITYYSDKSSSETNLDVYFKLFFIIADVSNWDVDLND